MSVLMRFKSRCEWQPRRLPYARNLACLRGTGKQYIDLGIKPSDSLGLKVVFRCTKVATANERICGSYCGSDGRYSVVARCSSSLGSTWYYGWNSASADINDTLPHIGNTKTCTLNYLNNRKVTFGSVTKVISETLNAIQNNNIVLFANNSDSGIIGQFHGNIYSAEITSGNNVIKRLIPVMMYNGKPAMYDEIGKEFYTNDGSGEFEYEEMSA